MKTKVVKLVLLQHQHGISSWEVVDVFEFDSNKDENMNTNFSHGAVVRATFIPVDCVQGFTEKTSVVSRTFDHNTQLESWAAAND